MSKFRHLNYNDRLRIEALVKVRTSKREIAKVIGCALSTVYAELSRGRYAKLDSEFRWVTSYSADIAQADYDYKATNKGAPLKIGNDHELSQYLERMILEEKLSPDVIIGRMKHEQKTFKTTICTRTFYNYIDKGIFLNVTNKDLFFHGERKRGYSRVQRISINNPLRRSISERPQDIELRNEFGHWEMDTVIGKARGKNSVLLVFTERCTRYELVMKIKSKTQLEVKKAVDQLERRFPDFRTRFKSITVDNGCEFINPKMLEQSCKYKGQKRTTVYYCHPYSSWERGSNENQNKLIRRYIPKGAPIDRYSRSYIQEVQEWMNNLPRKVLNYYTPAELYNLHTSAP